MNTALLLLLQAAATLLINTKQNVNTPLAVREQAILSAEHTIQLATQTIAMRDITFSIPKNASIWPNMQELAEVPYRSAENTWAPLGSSVMIVGSSVSFGDINNDGLDDAAVVVKQVQKDNKSNYALAVMLNQNDILFNIADVPLGSAVEIYSHSIQDGQIFLDMKVDDSARRISRYELLGNQLIKI